MVYCTCSDTNSAPNGVLMAKENQEISEPKNFNSVGEENQIMIIK